MYGPLLWTIVSETKNELVINTQYGELRFQKTQLKATGQRLRELHKEERSSRREQIEAGRNDGKKIMKSEKLLHRVLVSQDSGWYNVGEPKGGTYQPYDCIFNQLIPSLKENKFTQGEIDQIFKVNPVEAFKISIRKV